MTPHEEWVARKMVGRGWSEAEVMGALGIPFTPPPRAKRPDPVVTPEVAGKIRRLWSYGLGVIAIARALRVGERTVCWYAKTHPDECERRRPGRRRAEFDMEAAMDMRRRGATYKEISEAVGVSRSTVAAHLHEVGM